MGHFILELSNGEQADVRWGTLYKKQWNLLFWRSKTKTEKKKGYIVRIGSNLEYRFLRTLDGHWLSEGDDGFQVTADDPLELKAAIGRHENEH